MKHLQRWKARQSQSDPEAWGICVEGTEGKPHWIIYPTVQIGVSDAALIMGAHNAALAPTHSIVCSSITNEKLEPIVEIVMGEQVAHLDVRSARQVISHLQEATEAAMSDSMLTRFVRDVICEGKDDDKSKHVIGMMLVMFREHRKAFEGPIVESGENAS